MKGYITLKTIFGEQNMSKKIKVSHMVIDTSFFIIYLQRLLSAPALVGVTCTIVLFNKYT